MEDGQDGRLLFGERLEIGSRGRESNCVGKPIFFIFDLIGACLRLMVTQSDLIDASFGLIGARLDPIQHLLILSGLSSMHL
ncbi:hypothetical protein [Bacillus sp. E(2018)]|uniref:hypothetical protein n=1 Tax=Bacillus sp. E(2018) TaxID=2502239 RepID=UPI0010F7C024|nr:hypothetical protein [Bacillus sp. E(2018)]